MLKEMKDTTTSIKMVSYDTIASVKTVSNDTTDTVKTVSHDTRDSATTNVSKDIFDASKTATSDSATTTKD